MIRRSVERRGVQRHNLLAILGAAETLVISDHVAGMS